MKRTNIYIGIVSAFALAVIIFWILYNPVNELSISTPGLDNRPAVDSGNMEQVNIGEKFFHYKDINSELTGKWTRFRGADFDNIVKDKTPLIDTWGDGPNILWQVKLGEGHAAPVIWNGKVYILDYDEIKKADGLRCFSLETGEELWKRYYNVHIKRNHGMSRTVPAITKDYLITIGPKCHVMCVDPASGDLFWGLDMVKNYGTDVPFWYTGQCPIIDNDVAILAPGGSSLMIGVDCKTGEILWETPNPDNWQMSHSSIMPMNLNGKKMYVYAAVGGICGVSAEGNDLGEILWKTTAFNPSVVAPSPLVMEGGKILMTAGYGAGSLLFRVIDKNGQYSVEVIDKYKPKEGVACEQQTGILYENKIFAISPKDAGGLRNQFVCSSIDNTRNIEWTSGKKHRFGLGPYIIADGKFWILNDDGTVTIAKATSKQFEFLDSYRVIEGHDAWGPLAIADGYLVMRDSKNMLCINIRKSGN